MLNEKMAVGSHKRQSATKTGSGATAEDGSTSGTASDAWVDQPIDANCRQQPANSARRALDITGDRWTLIILHLSLLGTRRFEGFLSESGMARSLLTDRLQWLEHHGALRRVPYQERPLRHEYRLTEMGRDLFGGALMIIRWEKGWYPDPSVRAQRMLHRCGASPSPLYRCAECRRILQARDIRMQAGPGAGLDQPLPSRGRRRSTIEMEDGAVSGMLERALAVLGDRWTAHTIAAAFQGVRRYGDFLKELHIAPNLLADRLTRLCNLGILERRQYSERPPRHEYRLTIKGRDLLPLMMEQVRWGDRWLAGEKGPPDIFLHVPCGQPLRPEIACDHCHELITIDSVHFG